MVARGGVNLVPEEVRLENLPSFFCFTERPFYILHIVDKLITALSLSFEGFKNET